MRKDLEYYVWTDAVIGGFAVMYVGSGDSYWRLMESGVMYGSAHGWKEIKRLLVTFPQQWTVI